MQPEFRPKKVGVDAQDAEEGLQEEDGNEENVILMQILEMQPNYHMRDFLNMYAERLLAFNYELLDQKVSTQTI